MQPTIVALVSDLIFESRIRGTAGHCGAAVAVVRTADALIAQASGARSVLIDLDAPGLDSVATIQRLKAEPNGPRIVGFVSHVHVELRRAALAAGADEVLPRSVFVERLPSMLASAAQSQPPPA